MPGPRSLRQEFFKKWMLGLKICNSTTQNMTILERKNAIKLSADIAIASTKNGTTYWRRALAAKASEDNNNKLIVKRLLASEPDRLNKVSSNAGSLSSNKRARSKKILKKSRSVRRCVSQMVIAKSLAKRVIKKRIQVLKNLVPGGHFMEGSCLIEETLDYIVSLRAQVDVMRALAKATELANGK